MKAKQKEKMRPATEKDIVAGARVWVDAREHSGWYVFEDGQDEANFHWYRVNKIDTGWVDYYPLAALWIPKDPAVFRIIRKTGEVCILLPNTVKTITDGAKMITVAREKREAMMLDLSSIWNITRSLQTEDEQARAMALLANLERVSGVEYKIRKIVRM